MASFDFFPQDLIVPVIAEGMNDLLYYFSIHLLEGPFSFLLDFSYLYTFLFMFLEIITFLNEIIDFYSNSKLIKVYQIFIFIYILIYIKKSSLCLCYI